MSLNMPGTGLPSQQGLSLKPLCIIQHPLRSRSHYLTEDVTYTGRRTIERVMGLAAVEGARVRLGPLLMQHPLLDRSALQQQVMRHYTRALINELYKVVASADILGAPSMCLVLSIMPFKTLNPRVASEYAFGSSGSWIGKTLIPQAPLLLAKRFIGVYIDSSWCSSIIHPCSLRYCNPYITTLRKVAALCFYSAYSFRPLRCGQEFTPQNRRMLWLGFTLFYFQPSTLGWTICQLCSSIAIPSTLLYSYQTPV